MLGGKKDEKAPTVPEAIQKLRETEEMLMKKQDFLEKKIEIEFSTAKSKAAKNKTAALQALKRKKRYEIQLQQIDGTLSTIEMQREALEGANANTAVLTTMKNAANALKDAHKHMDVDQVQDMIDDIAEQQDIDREISDAISNPVAFKQDFNEDELEKELEELEQEVLEYELLKVGPSHGEELPSVPQSEVVKSKPAPRKVEEDDEMQTLAGWTS